jgi:formylglycine-generating enzyme required for sulfatase activity
MPNARTKIRTRVGSPNSKLFAHLHPAVKRQLQLVCLEIVFHPIARVTIEGKQMNLEESYRALGLKSGASLEEARRSYYERVKFFHPDRHQASPGLLRKATEETKKLNLAYERVCKVLRGGRRSAPEKRKQDKRSRTEGSGSPPIPGQGFVIHSCGIKLNWVAPGRFQMGSPVGEAGRSNDEGPQTEVKISRGFWLGIFTVMQEEWTAVAEEVSDLNSEPSYFRGNRLPVEQVSWEDCQAWLQALNRMEHGRLPHGFQYRLPTEAEWEFACRAGSSTRFCFGESDGPLGDYAWYSGNAGGQVHPVGEKRPNGWGFHDMHGNVWEWCDDRYGGPLPGGTVTDLRGVAGLNRVFRGGSWGVGPSRCRCAYRVWNKPAYSDSTLGFRVALAPAD